MSTGDIKGVPVRVLFSCKLLAKRVFNTKSKNHYIKMSFNEACLVEFECIVCYQYMHPPIRQCVEGHSYCHQCCERLERCPTCRGAHKSERHHLLEEIHNHIIFPCKYSGGGCVLSLLGSDILEHERRCPVTWKYCPFNVMGFCTWLGRDEDVAEHCLHTHTQHIEVGRKVEYNWRQFTSLKENYCQRRLLYSHKEIFCCNIFMDSNTDTVRWCVNHWGDEKRTLNFGFEVKVIVKDHPTIESGGLLAACGNSKDEPLDHWGIDVAASYSATRKYLRKRSFSCKLRIIEVIR